MRRTPAVTGAESEAANGSFSPLRSTRFEAGRREATHTSYWLAAAALALVLACDDPPSETYDAGEATDAGADSGADVQDAGADGGDSPGCGTLAEGRGECTGPRSADVCQEGERVAASCDEGFCVEQEPSDDYPEGVACAICSEDADGLCPDPSCGPSDADCCGDERALVLDGTGVEWSPDGIGNIDVAPFDTVRGTETRTWATGAYISALTPTTELATFDDCTTLPERLTLTYTTGRLGEELCVQEVAVTEPTIVPPPTCPE